MPPAPNTRRRHKNWERTFTISSALWLSLSVCSTPQPTETAGILLTSLCVYIVWRHCWCSNTSSHRATATARSSSMPSSSLMSHNRQICNEAACTPADSSAVLPIHPTTQRLSTLQRLTTRCSSSSHIPNLIEWSIIAGTGQWQHNTNYYYAQFSMLYY